MSKKYTKLSPYEIDRVWRYLSSFFEESNVREVSAVTEDTAEAFFRLGPLSKGFFPQTMRLLKSEQTYLQLSKFLGGGYWTRLGYWTRGSYYPSPEARLALTKGFLCACLERSNQASPTKDISPETKAHIAHLRRKHLATREGRVEGLSLPFNQDALPELTRAVASLEDSEMKVQVGDRLLVAKGPQDALSKISFRIV